MQHASCFFFFFLPAMMLALQPSSKESKQNGCFCFICSSQACGNDHMCLSSASGEFAFSGLLVK